jgi:hypothetical protein
MGDKIINCILNSEQEIKLRKFINDEYCKLIGCSGISEDCFKNSEQCGLVQKMMQGIP